MKWGILIGLLLFTTFAQAKDEVISVAARQAIRWCERIDNSSDGNESDQVLFGQCGDVLFARNTYAIKLSTSVPKSGKAKSPVTASVTQYYAFPLNGYYSYKCGSALLDKSGWGPSIDGVTAWGRVAVCRNDQTGTLLYFARSATASAPPSFMADDHNLHQMKVAVEKGTLLANKAVIYGKRAGSVSGGKNWVYLPRLIIAPPASSTSDNE